MLVFKEGVRGLRELEMLEWICYVRHEGHFEYGASEDRSQRSHTSLHRAFSKEFRMRQMDLRSCWEREVSAGVAGGRASLRHSPTPANLLDLDHPT